APSKTFNLAGLATAEVIIENKILRKRFNGVLYDSLHLFSGNVFGMVALQAAYSEEGEEWLVELMEYIQGNLDLLRDFISKNHPRIKLFKHEATYLAWMDFSNYNLSHKELMNVLVNEAKLGFNDGEIFGEEGKMKMRINLALPRQKLAQALSQLKVIEKY
ncbi:MAG: cystathionine beta-lyase, partial [Bacteroidales bacterium]|nr:cystathionine beta-lyase [Bacteroidales bacterium]